MMYSGIGNGVAVTVGSCASGDQWVVSLGEAWWWVVREIIGFREGWWRWVMAVDHGRLC